MPGLDFHRFDPSACAFPRPKVPVLAPLTWDQVRWRRARTDPRDVRHFARGRYALRAAYELLGVGPGGALLAPAYHCRTMLDGALRLGAEVVLYPLTPELDPDIAGLERRIAATRTPPVALLLTHYFGVPRDAGPVAAWCRRHGIALIEDCSHALVTSVLPGSPGCSMGHTGRYAVSSPYKFHPCPDGGLLWSPEGAPLPHAPGSPADMRAELRGLWHAWQQLRAARATPSTSALAAELAALGPRLGIEGREWIELAPQPGLSYEYAAGDEASSSLRVSRWIQRHGDEQWLLQRRRDNYARWNEAVQGLTGCRALFPDLPSGSTPYMFPLLVDDPMRRFYPLKQLGVPVWRWDDMAISDCAVSTRYRQGVFHLPCHQALERRDLEWMFAALRQVMAT